MKLYVVQEFHGFSVSGKIHGVFSTEKKAFEEVEKIKDVKSEYYIFEFDLDNEGNDQA